MSTRLDPSAHAWMSEPATRAVMDALTAGGGDARFVGGAVRNALLNEPVGEVDIATPLLPVEVMDRLQKAGLGAVPTGIEHGTVTAVAFSKGIEVTTLRRDVTTDGRRAVVAFTSEWKEDASRRDFTINALYADRDGAVFDYFGGIADIAARRVRFVGDPVTRIREDYLRILRLFRFHAWYGHGDVDAAALAACIAERTGLKKLSGERVQKEVLRLLEAADPVPSLTNMKETGILAEILPSGIQLARLAHLIAIGGEQQLRADPALRLAALLPDGAAAVRMLAGQLKLSNAVRDRLMAAADKDERIGPELPEAKARQLLYRMGRECFRDQLLLRWAASDASPRDGAWQARLGLAQAWTKPAFPIDGNDAMAEGIEEGPELGAILRDIEAWWIEQDFAPDRTALLARLKDAARRRV